MFESGVEDVVSVAVVEEGMLRGLSPRRSIKPRRGLSGIYNIRCKCGVQMLLMGRNKIRLINECYCCIDYRDHAANLRI